MKQNRLIIRLLTIVTIICLTSCDLFKKITPEEYIPPKEGDTLTVAQAIRYVQYLGVDSLSPYKVYIKGEIDTIYNSSDIFMRASFNISDPKLDNKFYCREVNYLQNSLFSKKDMIKVGDKVIVYGRVMNFKGTQPETDGGGKAYICDLNGKTEPDKTISEDEIETITIEQAIAIMDTLSTPYTIQYYNINCELIQVMSLYEDIISRGMATMIIKDSTGRMSSSNTRYLMNEPFTSLDQLPPLGSTLSIVGKLHKYNATTYQIANGYIKEIITEGNGTTTDDKPADPIIDPKEGDTLSVAQACIYVNQLGADVVSPQPVFVKGIVKEITQISTGYGNATFKISDADTDNSFTCYRVNYLENTPFTSAQQLVVGDEVVVYGKVLLFAGAIPETESNGAYIYSLNGQNQIISLPDVTPDTIQATIAEALDVISNMPDGGQTKEIYSIAGKIDSVLSTLDNVLKYNNVSFLVADESGNKIQAYQVTLAGGTLSELPLVGTKVIVEGPLSKYVKGEQMTPEIYKGSYYVVNE